MPENSTVRYEGLFTPPSLEGSHHPSMAGGGTWGRPVDPAGNCSWCAEL
jgi:hypothetical protein